MKNIILLIENNIKLYFSNKFMLLVILLGTPLLLWTGFLFSNESNIVKYRVAVYISDEAILNDVEEKLNQQDRLQYDVVSKEVSSLSLLNERYIAQVSYENDQIVIKLIHNNKEVQELKKILLNEDDKEDTTSALIKSTGFMIIFVMMISKLLQGTYFKDRENGVLLRMFSGTITYQQYAISLIIANCIEVFTPIAILTVFSRIIWSQYFTWNLGYMIMLELIMVCIAASFSFFVFNIFNDKITIEFVSSVSILISSILGGCVTDITDKNLFIQLCRRVLPQKNILLLAGDFQINYLLTLFVMIGVLILVGYYNGKKRAEG